MHEEERATGSNIEEDTISLVDLIAVLLRFRKLIMVSTVVAALLAVAAFFVIPEYQVYKAKKNSVIEASVSLILSPEFKTIFGEGEANNLVLQRLMEPVNILTALRAVGYEKLDDGTSIATDVSMDEALFAVRRRIVQNKAIDGTALKADARDYTVTLDKSVISVSFKNKNSETAKAFLKELVANVNKALVEYTRPFAENSIESYESLMLVERPSEVVGLTVVSRFPSYLIIKDYVLYRTPLLDTLIEPYVLLPTVSKAVFRSAMLKKGIILVFGVFFLTVFAAFVLQYIDSVKKDPEAVAKLREAMGER